MGCKKDNCERPGRLVRGWCQYHYDTWHRTGTPVIVEAPRKRYAICTFDACEQRAWAREWCKKHYTRWQRYGDPSVTKKLANGTHSHCTVDGCDRKHEGRGFCAMHHARLKNRGNVGSADRETALPNQPRLSREGYLLVWDTELGRPIPQHRVVMEQHLGRPLLQNETVHHKNGNRSDNRIENLEMWSSAQPKGQRIPDKVEYALEIVALYAPEFLVEKKVA